MGDPKVDNLLHISWCDSRWAPGPHANNVLDYFSERSNPFYSRECNNEFIKMQQNARIDQLQHMQGTEYVLLHAQDPILYIVRKQHRYSPTQVSPLSCYHIIAGQVFQTPDLGAVINSRLVSAINHINGAFTELQTFSQYHPSRGYWWQTQKSTSATALESSLETQKKAAEKKASRKEEVASAFQRRRVDLLLTDLANKFPYKPQAPVPPAITAASSLVSAIPAQPPPSHASNTLPNTSESVKTDDLKSEGAKNDPKQVEVKTENEPKVEVTTPPQRTSSTKPPPEKRQKQMDDTII